MWGEEAKPLKHKNDEKTVLVRLVCTLAPRSASVALYEQTVVSSARTGTTEYSEPSIAPVWLFSE